MTGHGQLASICRQRFEMSLGSGMHGVVNPERGVQQRVREFEARFSITGGNRPR